MKHRTIHSARHHFGWDRTLEPVQHVASGDTVTFEVLEASGGRITPQSKAPDVLDLEPARANPVTGPVHVEDAEPGDVLVIDIVEFGLSGWGWTAIIPEFGLLAESFPEPYLHHSRYDGNRVEFTPEIHLPTRPFTGTLGVAPAAPGWHSAIPPRRVGGNLDLRDIVTGARVRLPVEVPGALFSVGDTHAAQGDGEVCGTAIETPLTVMLRFGLEKRVALAAPRIELPEQTVLRPPQSWLIATGIGEDLHQAARDAVSGMIEHLEGEYGLTPELAYCLCSVAVDLRISEIVNAPNWVVSAYLPRGIFV